MHHRRMWTVAALVAAAALLAAGCTGDPSPGTPGERGTEGVTAPGTATTTGAAEAGRRGCASQPSACGWPDASNTGVPPGTALTVHQGNLAVQTRGAVVEGLDIRGCVVVKARDVTIRRSRVACEFGYAIASFPDEYDSGGLVVEDVEIDCHSRPVSAIGYSQFVARRVDIHHCENGFDIDDNVTVEDSYIHDLTETGGGHADGAQLAGGANIVIRHNTILVPGGTSAIISGKTTNVTVERNLLGGGAYTLYCPDESTDYRVVDNRFAGGYAYGPWTECEQVAETRGNMWDSDLTLVPL